MGSGRRLVRVRADRQVHIGKAGARYRLHRPVDEPPLSHIGAREPSREGSLERERPLEGGGQRVKTHLAPRPHQALGLGGRSPPRPCCPVRHGRPGGDERNSKRPHGIGESGVCASSGVHCVHRPPTSHARSSTAQVVGFSSESRAHEPNRPPCVGALHQPPTRLPARTLRQRDAALHGGLQAAVLHEDPDITLDDGPVDPVDLAADFVVEFGGVGISRPDTCGSPTERSILRARCVSRGRSSTNSSVRSRSGRTTRAPLTTSARTVYVSCKRFSARGRTCTIGRSRARWWLRRPVHASRWHNCALWNSPYGAGDAI